MRKPKLVNWSPQIRLIVKEKKSAFAQWKKGGCPDDPNHPVLIAKPACRNQTAVKHREERQEILDAKSHDVQLFYKLIRKQRGSLTNYIDELHVAEDVYKGEDVLSGWFKHFSELSTTSDNPSFDEDYHNLVLQDLPEIEGICLAQGQLSAPVTVEELKKAIKNLNRGKAADVMGVTAEHLVLAEDTILVDLCLLINKIFEAGHVTDSMKLGLVTPVFKKKGSNTHSKNYKGITVIPILTKLLETIIRSRFKPLILENQNNLQ